MNQFNLPNSLLVITSYPNPKNNKYGRRDLNAVAWHSEKTLKDLSNDRKIIVFAEKTNKEDKSFYANKNMYVNRIWSKTNHFSMFKIAVEALKLNYVKSIFIPFEFNVFGGTFHNLLFLIVLLFMKLNGKHIVIEIHQVIEDIKKLEKHINIVNPYVQKFYNFGLKMYYSLFGLLTNKVIVFEEELKTRLKRYIDEQKINVLSLGTVKNRITNQNYARKRLNLSKKEFLIMVFGYINGYKGLEFMIDSFKNSKIKNTKLIIAGGKNPYLKDKKFYQRFYKKIVTLAKSNKKIIQTGFIPDKKVSLYFSAVDLVILPYEVFMSASGPFSLALSYGKPVILSEKLIRYKESEDFKMTLKETNSNIKDVFFPLKKEALIKIINKTKNNKKYYERLVLFSKKLSEKRSSNKNIVKYKEILFSNSNLGLKLLYNQ